LNLKNEKDYGDEYFTGSLLSLYEQKIYFLNHEIESKEFNIENPLMIFVGTSVSGKKTKSDVYHVCEFFSRFISEKTKYRKIIKDIIENKTSLLDSNNQPVFHLKFQYLRQLILDKQLEINSIYDEMLKLLFHSTTVTKIRFIVIKNADGEIGLKLGDKYFGLINIGDVPSFLKLIENNDYFEIGQPSHFEDSLFRKLEEKDSPINFLIGSKKFLEGWNSYRVSAMGLLNIGKRQGSQIIQLFGRGIRLKGYKNLLKRSYALELDPKINLEIEIPEFFTILETLNIFGLNADYMAVFRETLKEEGVEEYEKFTLSIKSNVPSRNLYIPQILKNPAFFKDEVQILSLTTPNVGIPKVRIDLSSKVELLESTESESLSLAASPLTENQLSDDILEIIDFQKVYLELLKYKNLKNYSNLYFTKKDLIDILKSKNYSIYSKKELLELYPFEELAKIYKIEDYVIQLLKTVIDKIYNQNKYYWYQKNINLETISEEDKSFIPKEYVFIVNASEQALIKNIREFIDQLKTFIQEKSEFTDDIYSSDTTFSFKGNKILDFFALNIHLFKPLIFKNKSERLKFIKISPLDLVESERDFIKLLDDYIEKFQDELPFDEIYLLRNPSRKGVGFFKTKNFYPDFILWIIKDDQQTISFIDPKGLVFISKHDEKIKLHKDIKEIEKELSDKTSLNLTLNSYILSKTAPETIVTKWGMSKDELLSQNILFLDDKFDCISRLLGV